MKTIVTVGYVIASAAGMWVALGLAVLARVLWTHDDPRFPTTAVGATLVVGVAWLSSRRLGAVGASVVTLLPALTIAAAAYAALRRPLEAPRDLDEDLFAIPGSVAYAVGIGLIAAPTVFAIRARPASQLRVVRALRVLALVALGASSVLAVRKALRYPDPNRYSAAIRDPGCFDRLIDPQGTSQKGSGTFLESRKRIGDALILHRAEFAKGSCELWIEPVTAGGARGAIAIGTPTRAVTFRESPKGGETEVHEVACESVCVSRAGTTEWLVGFPGKEGLREAHAYSGPPFVEHDPGACGFAHFVSPPRDWTIAGLVAFVVGLWLALRRAHGPRDSRRPSVGEPTDSLEKRSRSSEPDGFEPPVRSLEPTAPLCAARWSAIVVATALLGAPLLVAWAMGLAT
jgi:hypothetical protein